jgi:CDP-diacylglycerol--glycerol-3-phosphate 3-phosphatidyltransferase
VSVPASRAAKYKTVLQQLAVGFALLPLTALDATWLWNTLLWAAVVLAIYSGVQYFWRASHTPQVDPARLEGEHLGAL